MQDHPTSRELIEAVSQFLEREVTPTLGGPRLRFRALVAANVLNVIARELEMGVALTRAEWMRLTALMGDDAPGTDLPAEIVVMTRALCAKIRAGEVDEGAVHDAVFAHAQQTVIEKLQVANPRYLERFTSSSGDK